ncbi:guanine nucleotide exchange protein for ADP-robosylation factor [Tulasnella sp. 424]|nr:guanine nucleotide exchange protein for ADP-robosylation factor [Tulasnella sp. 424]KAG8970777.1 guanine nucleotide exchange protein for ADP-robosylation factor [Tulasnella sp. 425]
MDPASDTVDPATQNTAAVVSVEEEEEGVTTPTPAPKIELPPPTLEIHPPEEDLKEDGAQAGGAEETTEVDVDDKKDLPKPDQEQGDAQDGGAAEAETETPIAERPPPPPPKPVDDRDLDSDGETDEPPKVSPAESANGSRRESLVHGPAPVDAAALSSTSDSIPPPMSSRSPPPPPKTHSQRPSISGASSVMAPRGNPVSVVLIASSLETIVASKEAKRSPQLKESATAALEMIRNGQGGDRPREIFEPLRLACDTKNEKLMIASLDCIQKLISYSFFAETVNPALQQEMSAVSPPPSPGTAASTTGAAPMSLADLVTHTITAAYSESIPDSVSLQIVKALLSLVLSNTILVHHSSLLKAVRTVYNVFLLSTDPVNQMVAQGGLTQMVNHVFSRAKIGTPENGTAATVDSPVTPANGDVVADIHARLAREGVILPKRKSTATPSSSNPTTPNSEAMAFRMSTTESVAKDSGTNGLSSGAGDSAPTAAETSPTSESADSETKDEAKKPSLTIQTTSSTPPTSAGLESNFDTSATTSRRGTPAPEHSTSSAEHSLPRQITTNDLFIKDAFLVFRALCKLTMKPLNNESERDLKSHAMRSKLLSLQLVLQILDDHLPIFVDPTSIIYSSSSDERTPFLHASKQYLCLSLSRNAVSPVNQVFEISVEIFWRVLMGMRTKLKKEIEVLLNEIFLPILEMRTATLRQKSVLLAMLYRLAQDPQALVEIYLNYDCDRDATENIYERLMNVISKMVTTKAAESKDAAAKEPADLSAKNQKLQHGPTFPASPNTTVLGGKNAQDSVATLMPGFTEVKLKRQSLEALVAVLRSLVVWGTGAGGGGLGTGLAGGTVTNGTSLRPTSNGTLDADSRPSSTRISGEEEFAGNEAFIDRSNSLRSLRGGASTPDLTDDPGRFETAKQRKTTLLEGIRKFNFKPKRGIKFLIDAGFIKSSEPGDVARFLHETDGLSKAMIGEYLGEGDEENIATMHAFVDALDFKELPFVDALRMFLQSFRLPGESQKIDRFMLKFAERYMDGNPTTVFKNADTAYVLAYSTIMLNTDLYNPQVKNRMNRQGFLRNNAGINDGSDLPEELLNSIFDEISNNEIRMKDEVEAAILNAPVPATGLGALALGRDLQKEAYVMQSTGMANKTEALFKTMMRAQKKGSKSSEQFFSASHSVHVRPMFEVAWMSFLAGISGPLQDTDDLEIVELCLDGFKSAIRIVCVFDLELERNAFVTTLAKFTFLNNLGEMKAKNMEAIKALLDIAVTEGNHLKGSWHEVLTCVSQLERMQLISNGIDVPDTGRASGAGRGGPSKMKRLPAEDLANESRSTHITVAADMVFSLSHYLSGTAIVDFVQALSDVSWEEIVSSGTSQHPRMFSLQKLVDISYYNMNRIRLEWSNMWTILGEHFNQVCTHTNPHVAFFALDALRQLAMRFLEKEELAHFKFQKDFLKPFEYTMIHNQNPEVREMILQCLQQMIQLRVHNIRSGWRTMFGVFSAASKSLTERVANMAFEVVTRLNKEHFTEIVRYGAFADLTVCITDFCKVSKYQKISLLAIGMLRGVVPTMINTPETQLGSSEAPTSHPAETNGAVPPTDDPMIKFWYPVLLSFYDIIMEGEDLEVRRLALDSLFSTLKTYGSTFRPDFWDTVCQELLFRIFAVLRSSQEMSRFSTQEDMSVWLSTTMIQALRNLIDLYTFYFDILERTLDGLLDLLCVCICQENDTLARIGTSCFQQLLENNAKKLSPTRWQAVVKTFVRLFKTTTPHQLFDESLRAEIGENPLPDQDDTPNGKLIPAPLSPSKAAKRQSAGDIIADRRRTFKQIIVKCVLQLLLIETTNELLHNDDVYNTIPPDQLLHLMKVLDHSYQFARSFNADKELRTGLWKVGFMKHLPNLLKQESSSAATLVNVLSRMYYDKRPAYIALHQQIGERLVPLGLGVVEDFNTLRMDTQAKNIAAWTPVIAEVLNGFASFDDHSFSRYLPAIYPLATELLARDLAPEVREAVRRIFVRVGIAKGITMS